MKRLGSLLACLLVLTGLLAGQAAAAETTPTAPQRLQALEQKILTLLNETRVARGLRRVTPSTELRGAAIVHSRSMLQDGYFKHESADGSSFFERVKRFYSPAGYTSWSVGENLLFSTTDIDAAAAIKTWLESPAHRHNMLSAGWREVGISARHADAAGGTFGGEPTLVITMDFGVRTGAPGQVRKPQAATATRPRTPSSVVS